MNSPLLIDRPTFAIRPDTPSVTAPPLWRRMRRRGLELKNTPVLHSLARNSDLQARQPFGGLQVLIAMHALTNLCAFLTAMMELGLKPSTTMVCLKDYAYPEKAAVKRWLRQHGFKVRSVDDIDAEFLAALEAEVVAHDRRILAIEDGGYFSSAVHALWPGLLPRFIGIVEQTTRGITRLLDAAQQREDMIGLPVVSVPDSSLKKSFEPLHIGEGVFLALLNLLSRPLRRMRVCVLGGHGVIGRALAERLTEAGAWITVYDPALLSEPGALYLPYEIAETPVAAARDAELIIGATGRQSVTRDVIDAARDGCYIVSVSSDRNEIDMGYLEANAVETEILRHSFFFCEGGRQKIAKGKIYRMLPDCRELFVLHDGRPINFLGFGGMLDREADLILALMFAGAADLASGRYDGRTGILRDAINAADLHYGIGRTFVGFHRYRR